MIRAKYIPDSIVKHLRESTLWIDARRALEEVIKEFPGSENPPLSVVEDIITMIRRVRDGYHEPSERGGPEWSTLINRFFLNYGSAELCSFAWSEGWNIILNVNRILIEHWNLPVFFNIGKETPDLLKQSEWIQRRIALAFEIAGFCEITKTDWIYKRTATLLGKYYEKELSKRVIVELFDIQEQWAYEIGWEVGSCFGNKEILGRSVYSGVRNDNWNPFFINKFPEMKELAMFTIDQNVGQWSKEDIEKMRQQFEVKLTKLQEIYLKVREFQRKMDYNFLIPLLEQLRGSPLQDYVLTEVIKESPPLSNEILSYFSARVYDTPYDFISLMQGRWGLPETSTGEIDRDFQFRLLCAKILNSYGYSKALIAKAKSLIEGSSKSKKATMDENHRIGIALHIIYCIGESIDKEYLANLPRHIKSRDINFRGWGEFGEQNLFKVALNSSENPLEFCEQEASNGWKFIKNKIEEEIADWNRIIKVGHLFSKLGPFPFPRIASPGPWPAEFREKFPIIVGHWDVLRNVDQIFEEVLQIFKHHNIVIETWADIAQNSERFEKFSGRAIPDFIGPSVAIHLRDPGRSKQAELVRGDFICKYAEEHGLNFLVIDPAEDWRADVDRFLTNSKPTPQRYKTPVEKTKSKQCKKPAKTGL